MSQFLTTRPPPRASNLALRFIFVSAGVYAAAGLLAYVLVRFIAAPMGPGEALLPRAFWFTTALLIAGSAALQRAVWFVRREKQDQFRRCLVSALVSGTLFVGIQSYALWGLVRHQNPEEVQTGANAFLTMLATLHAMHFTLALLFLVWVTLNALADRYDHEYFWGVTVCASFWHLLGIAWIVILAVFLIAA
jgi:cytochrome c oxidase subunit 3